MSRSFKESVRDRVQSLLVQVHEVLLGDDADRPEKHSYLVRELQRDKANKSAGLVDKQMQLSLLSQNDQNVKSKFEQTVYGLRNLKQHDGGGDKYQCPPLHLAVWLMKRNWVIFLLEADANPLLEDSAGQTAVDVAFLRSGEVLDSDPHQWQGSCSQD